MTARVRRFWRRIDTSITYRGIAFTILWCVMFAVRLAPTKWFMAYRAKQLDRRYGVDTAGMIDPSALGLTQREADLCVEYQPCTPELLSEVLSTLSVSYQDYVFVDLGTGKGVPLLVASMFPFMRIEGVEWSQRLSSVARENVRKFSHRRQRCRDITVIDGDAAAYELPEEPLVIFMFNPFKEQLVRRVLCNLGDSLQRHPRHVVLVYYNPVCKQAVSEADFLRPIERSDSYAVAIYETQRVAPNRVAGASVRGRGRVQLSGVAVE